MGDNKENQMIATHPHSTNDAESPSHMKEDLLDMIAGMQSRRMDEQRASLPRLPGLNNAHPDILRRLSSNTESSGEDAATLPDENFFSLIMRLQSGRLEDQRAEDPSPIITANGA